MPRTSHGWRWVGGVCTPIPAAVGFVRTILADPGDATARLVLADLIEDDGRPGTASAAESLRTPGGWQIGGATGGRHLGLTWWPADRYYGQTVALIARPHLPACRAAHPRPIFEPNAVLFPARGSAGGNVVGAGPNPASEIRPTIPDEPATRRAALLRHPA